MYIGDVAAELKIASLESWDAEKKGGEK